MGSSNIADCLTGLPIQQGDPVVAFVLDQTEGGYPDAGRTRAMIGPLFNGACQIVSLPIHGAYADFKDIAPAPKQLSAALAIRMTGAKDWAEFSSTALSFEVGATIQRDRRMDRVFGGGEPRPRIFGLAAMHRSSWDHLLAMMPPRFDRQEEAAAVAWAIRDVCARSNGGERGDRLYMQREALVGLSAHGYEAADGRAMDLPDMASAFSTNRDTYGRDFVRWAVDLVLRPSLVGDGANGAPWLEEFLGGVWDTRAFEYGMRWNNRVLLPSASAGQSRDLGKHFDTALLAIEQASLPMLVRINDNGGEGIEEMEALLAKLDALRTKLGERLDREREVAADMEP